MSHKMFYSEIKERESILEMINKTVSHELRNPISAIFDQIGKLQRLIKYLSLLLLKLKEYPQFFDLCAKLETLQTKLSEGLD